MKQVELLKAIVDQEEDGGASIDLQVFIENGELQVFAEAESTGYSVTLPLENLVDIGTAVYKAVSREA